MSPRTRRSDRRSEKKAAKKSTRPDKKDAPKKKKSHDKDNKQPKSSSEAPKNEEVQYIELYCAIYNPHFGNYYHWAFAIHNPANMQWLIFEVVQDEQDGPFRAEQRAVDPRNSRRCQNPLTFLGHLDPSWMGTLMDQIAAIRVPGESLFWNCQEYVLEIWEIMLNCGMIDEETWRDGRDAMLTYYGQDFGGDDDDDEGPGEEEEDGSTQRGQALSAEYVYDSDSC